ncbi:MAG TPA: metallophosphoesterase family protein [Terriglobales bacterium]|nr:metallophosphoesterase family protein [Terriglobales bacterium]
MTERNGGSPETTIVGVISDTHGLVRPEALDALRGSHLILHAGDVGSSAVLDLLSTIAPVIAVRGNIDTAPWADQLPVDVVVEVGSASIYILHDIARMDLVPEAAGFGTVIYGHSHKPEKKVRGGVLYLNPGSAGPRRFKLPVSVGRLVVTGSHVEAELITLEA